MGVIRTLVLSGGGGRGAFHAGVYRYLCQQGKPGVNDAHQEPWKPDIVVGTSIGAVNGAAIIQGVDSEELVAFWDSLREHDIEGLPPNMPPMARWVVNQFMKNLIGVKLPPVPREHATSRPPRKPWLPLPFLGRWANLLDTGPLRRTLMERLCLDEQRIAASPGTLLINATNVSTGQRITFSNHPIYKRATRYVGSGQRRPTAPEDKLLVQRRDVLQPITVNRILASCSIPLVYPWTYDDLSDGVYWDGAVVANTPLGVSLDAANTFPVEDIMEVVVVLMTPWRKGNVVMESEQNRLPQDFTEAITWVLDWALLASFRERLDLIQAYNRLGDLGRRIGDPELSAIRRVRMVIVAPDDFFPAARIIDYDEFTHHLIELGYHAAERTFQERFPVGGTFVEES